MTEPIKEIIPRDIPQNIISTLNLFADTLEEFVNFGSHILAWDDNPITKGEENIAPTMLFRHFLDLIDSISVLARKSCGDPAKLLIRGALETMLGIEYLFEKDTYDRALAFLVIDTTNQIKILKKLNAKTQEGKKLNKIIKDESIMGEFRLSSELDLDDEVVRKESVLKQPKFQRAMNEYDQLKLKNEKNPKWYRLFDGPRSIEELAIRLKRRSFYELLYRKWSGPVHGSDIFLGRLLQNEEKGVDIVQLRFVKDLQEVVKFSMILSLVVFKAFIENRLPDKKPIMGQWYLSIRETFFNILQNNLIVVK